jgi:hypothetical protein
MARPEPGPGAIATVRPARGMRAVTWPDGRVVTVPEGWELLPPGDAGVTRRVKAAGPHWVVQEQVGRRLMSRGVWAPRAAIEAATKAMERDRADPSWQAGLARGRERRAREQDAYVLEFTRHVLAFLAFPPRHAALAQTLATRVAVHTTPVGSGTVARTSRIPVAQRAEAALIAWLRHQTTTYDHMHIARVKGARREVRRELARDSRRLLERYRAGLDPAADCPLQAALALPEAPPDDLAEAPPAERPRFRLRPAAPRGAGVLDEGATSGSPPAPPAQARLAPSRPRPEVAASSPPAPAPEPQTEAVADARLARQLAVRARLARR